MGKLVVRCIIIIHSRDRGLAVCLRLTLPGRVAIALIGLHNKNARPQEMT